MEPFTAAEIRRSFVNCSRGEAQRLTVPRELAGLPWADLDFLGWRDPKAPERGYLVARHQDRVTGIVLRYPQGRPKAAAKTSICSLCLTPHSSLGVSLLVAPRVGAAGRRGDTVGAYLCADLACSLYLRGIKIPDIGLPYSEALTTEEKAARVTEKLDAFLGKVLDGA